MRAGTRPQTVPDLLSGLDERIRRLEQARTLTVGPWVLSVDASGVLVARNTETGVVRPLALPTEAP